MSITAPCPFTDLTPTYATHSEAFADALAYLALHEVKTPKSIEITSDYRDTYRLTLLLDGVDFQRIYRGLTAYAYVVRGERVHLHVQHDRVHVWAALSLEEHLIVEDTVVSVPDEVPTPVPASEQDILF